MSRDAPRSGAVVKRSLAIAGHRTSVSLEEAFWARLAMIAKARSLSVAALVGAIDATRGEANLSSAIRVYVLEDALGNRPADASANASSVARLGQ